jgi:hypothetical protein
LRIALGLALFSQVAQFGAKVAFVRAFPASRSLDVGWFV